MWCVQGGWAGHCGWSWHVRGGWGAGHKEERISLSRPWGNNLLSGKLAALLEQLVICDYLNILYCVFHETTIYFSSQIEDERINCLLYSLRFFIPRHISHKPGVLCPPCGWCRLGLGIKWAVNNDKYTLGAGTLKYGGYPTLLRTFRASGTFDETHMSAWESVLCD